MSVKEAIELSVLQDCIVHIEARMAGGVQNFVISQEVA